MTALFRNLMKTTAPLFISALLAQQALSLDTGYWKKQAGTPSLAPAAELAAALESAPADSIARKHPDVEKAERLCEGADKLLRQGKVEPAEKIISANVTLLAEALVQLETDRKARLRTDYFSKAAGLARKAGQELDRSKLEEAAACVNAGRYAEADRLYGRLLQQGLTTAVMQLKEISAAVTEYHPAEFEAFGKKPAARLFDKIGECRTSIEQRKLNVALEQIAEAQEFYADALAEAGENRAELLRRFSSCRKYKDAERLLSPYLEHNPPLPVIEELRLKALANLRFKPGRQLETESGIKLVYIPPGTFQMGSPEREPGHSPEERIRPVTISHGFFMGIYEVTRSEWNAVMNPAETTDPQTARRPKDNVSWHDAVAFCDTLNRKESGRTYRLPTEAEWEYACRAGTATAFHSGGSLQTDSAAVFSLEHPRTAAAAAGRYTSNAWGLYDMHGNLAEWCMDWADGHADPDSGRKVIRGGSWVDEAENARSAARQNELPIIGTDTIGFRVVLEAAGLTL